MRTRAARCLAERHLVVDYYRIGRRLAFPLLLDRIPSPRAPVTGIPDYPWEIWLAWRLEDRLNTLGWAASWFKDAAAAAQAGRELEAMARWPAFTPNARLDLCLGHVSRTMCEAYRKWDWLTPATRDALGRALDRLVADAAPWVKERFGAGLTARDILDSADPHTRVHNIPFIGLIGAAMAANTRGAAPAASLNGQLTALIEVLTTLRQSGYSEAVGYDGYLLDFVTSWLATLPPASRESVLRRFDLEGFFPESCMLGAPGDATRVAELSDVEPHQMPFHISAQARLQSFRPQPLRAWYLRQCRLDVLRSDTLALLRTLAAGAPQGAPPPAVRVLDAHYAKVLRSGWAASDLAVAVAAGNSPAGHIHFDFGSITIGTAGRWLIADPGYQQYMPGEEREFTIGPRAHNAPVLDGRAQEKKAGRVLSEDTDQVGTLRLALDLTACYPAELGVGRAMRTVWLAGKSLVVVADELDAGNAGTQAYHWHGAPDAAWQVRDNWAMLYAGKGATIWFSSPGFAVSDADLVRLPGSRGQVSLVCSRKPVPVTWWVFATGDAPPAVASDAAARSLRIGGLRFSLD